MKALEIMRSSHDNIRKLYMALLLLSGGMTVLIVLCFYLLYVTGKKAPLVIRVSEAGKAEVISLNTSGTPASSVEIKYLAKELAETIFGFSRLTYEEDLKRVMPYISFSLKSTLLDQYRRVASTYISQNTEFRVDVFAVVILSSSLERVQVRVDYFKRDTMSGEDKKFYCVMVFKRTKRTIHNPFGLELLQLQEHRYLNVRREE